MFWKICGFVGVIYFGVQAFYFGVEFNRHFWPSYYRARYQSCGCVDCLHTLQRIEEQAFLLNQ